MDSDLSEAIGERAQPGRATEKEKTMELMTKIRWPAKGDRLLRAEGDWQRAVTFREQEVARHVDIWDGYMRAGAVLIEHCERTNNRVDRHELVYPILFSYRHGLELAMKWIISCYGRFAGISPDDQLHHDLWQLWQACKKVILVVGSDGETEALIAVERVIKEFHDLDKGSFSFRYSQDKNGMVIRLPTGGFDLTNIKNVMEAVNNLFTGEDGQLDHNSSVANLKASATARWHSAYCSGWALRPLDTQSI